MELTDVLTASRTAVDGKLDLEIVADIGNGNETLPFTYAPGDPHGLTPQVAAWFVAHPDFPIGDYVAPEDPPVVLTPTLIAMGQVKTADGDITSVAISAALAGAFVSSAGEIWCFFVEEQPDTDYIVLAYDANTVRAFVEDEDKATGYFVIRCVDFSGTPTNPPSLNFEVKRVI